MNFDSMEALVNRLPGEGVVLDLGAGGGSFRYSATPALVLAVDLDFPAAAQSCALRMKANSAALPLSSSCVDVVICNHTLEHFEELEKVVLEINRVLKPGGYLWGAVPDSSSLDDRLYRFLFAGGGHVNPFHLQSFIDTLEARTQLRAGIYKRLYSGFVYLFPPTPERRRHYPRRARTLLALPSFFYRSLVRWMGYLTRLADRTLGTDLSYYGWAVIFERGRGPLISRSSRAENLPALPEHVNVCGRCGSSEPAGEIQPRLKRFLFWRHYRCLNCGEKNIFSQDPSSPPVIQEPRRSRSRVPEPKTRVNTSPATSMEDTARAIFGAEHPESVDHWLRFWSACRERTATVLSSFRPLVLLDTADKSVLDIGCGTGGLGEVLSGSCRLYVGADYYAHVLRFASPAPNRVFVQCTGEDLPFPDRSFDYIFALDVLEHVVGGKEAQIRFLAEMRRVLSPLGMIFLTTPNRLYPYEGHTRLYGPQFVPRIWRDSFIRRLNPGFLQEHSSFDEIQSLTPAGLASCLKSAGLEFLHDLPCSMDKADYRRQFPLRGVLPYLGLGWLPHAEFWGILVARAARERLRLKLKKNWFYEQRQASPDRVADFASRIDFEQGFFNPQLGPGWYWHERDRQGFRWTSQEAVCYLQSGPPVNFVQIHGFAPRANTLTVAVEDVVVGKYFLEEGTEFRLENLMPYERQHTITRLALKCSHSFRPETAGDERDLGVMIFSAAVA